MRDHNRRAFLTGTVTGVALAMSGRSLAAQFPQPSAALLQHARAALDRHDGSIVHRDRVAVVDFSRPSSEPRLFIVDLISGASSAHLVAHGRGSDPAHSGWVQRFSNEPGSYASSEGAYASEAVYPGKHGTSLRLAGLDPENSNAEPRAIVVHAAWYVAPEMVREHGKLGRSEGCFAVAQAELAQVIERLGTGRLLYAGKA
jgi:hypothetical protein